MGSWPGSISIFQNISVTSTLLSVSPERWAWTWVGIPQQAFFQGWLFPVLLASDALSDPVLFDTVVQHWPLAIDHDHIAVGLSFESPPICTISINGNYFWQVHGTTIGTLRASSFGNLFIEKLERELLLTPDVKPRMVEVYRRYFLQLGCMENHHYAILLWASTFTTPSPNLLLPGQHKNWRF